MKQILGLFKKRERLYDWLSILFGILLCVTIFFVIRNPSGRTGLILLVFAGGGLNIINGLKLYRKPKQRNLGTSMMMLGVIILFIGLYAAAALV